MLYLGDAVLREGLVFVVFVEALGVPVAERSLHTEYVLEGVQRRVRIVRAIPPCQEPAAARSQNVGSRTAEQRASDERVARSE